MESTWCRPYKLGYDAFEYVMYLYRAPVSFAAKRLKVVALSSAAAEYVASSCACREIVFVRNVLADLGFTISQPTVLAVDNQAALRIAENLGTVSSMAGYVTSPPVVVAYDR